MKKILGLVLILVGVSILSLVATPKAQATFNTPHFDICDILPWLPICEEEEEPPVDYCETVEGVQPEDYDCPVPEEEVCPPGTHEQPYEENKEVVWDEELICIPDETPTPPVCTENCGNPPTFAGSSTNPPVCTNGNTTKVVGNGHVIRNGAEATVNAFITEGDSVNVYWRIVGSGGWQHSSAAEYPEGLKPNGDRFITYTVKGLNPTGDYDFGIEQKNGCGGGTIAVIKDSYAPQVFTVTSYE